MFVVGSKVAGLVMFNPPAQRMLFTTPALCPSCSRGSYGPPILNFLTISCASRLSSGVKSMRSLSVSPSGSIGSGLVGNGCVGDVQLPGTVVCGTGRSSIGHTGSPVTRLNVKMKPCFVVWMTAGTGLPLTDRFARIGTFGRS